MHRRLFKTGALVLGLAVVLGAFGAHLLKQYLSPELLAGYQTAVQYQMVHGIGLFIAGFLYKQYHNKKMVLAGRLFLYGILCFSGSIYLRVVVGFWGITSLGLVNLVTPLGGVLFIAGWLLLFVTVPSLGNSASDGLDKDKLNSE
ncbi:MAG: hypothetical protein RLZZ595_796 [Bacteroidota bacterium]|jgi:uncharacterized membrane protein YgdD (TMEM256/DUF423 family)